MRIKKYVYLIVFIFCAAGINSNSQSFFKKYPTPSGKSKVTGTGALIIPSDSNQIALVGMTANDFSFAVVTDSLGDTLSTHGDFLPWGWIHDLYGGLALNDLIEVPGGYAFYERGCTQSIVGHPNNYAAIFFTDRRLHVTNKNILGDLRFGSVYNPNIYNFNNSVYFTGTVWSSVDTCPCPYVFAPIYTPIWKMDNTGNHIWSDSLYPEIYKSQIYYSIPTADSQIAVLGFTPPKPDTIRLKFYNANGNLKNNYHCSQVIYAIPGELVRLRNNILIIGTDADSFTGKVQLVVETTDSLGGHLINAKRYTLQGDTANVTPISVYKLSDSSALINYSVAGSSLEYYLVANSQGDSLGGVSLPACTNIAYHNNNIICEKDSTNVFIVRAYSTNQSLLYQYIYPFNGTGVTYNLQPLPNGKGYFIMTGELNDTVFIIRQDTNSILTANNSPKTQARINVYPNPNNGSFILSLSNIAGKCKVEIYNVIGEKVTFETLKQVQGDYSLNLSNEPNGVYFYRVLKSDGSLIGDGKLIIQK